MARHLHRFHGGLALAGHKAESARSPIRACPLPPRLYLPLLQHAGVMAEPLVEPGARVAPGQRVAAVCHAHGVAIHAPAAGRYLGLRDLPIGSRPDLDVPHIELELDPGQAAPVPATESPLPPLDPWTAPRAELLDRIRDAGVAGLGGAGFPSAEKLAVPRELLVINGAECEPWITCDNRLMQERASELVDGARLLQRLVGAHAACIAIEDDMREALGAVEAALAAPDAASISAIPVPTRYPEGGERQLIRVLTGREVPRGGLPRDIGIVVHNVGTVLAIWQAVTEGRPLVSRVVTVTGPGVARPGNFDVAIGTPVAHLIEAAGGYTERAQRLVMGGPMMGQALPHDGVSVSRTTQCILVLDREPGMADAAPMPCIRCGDCTDVCPARLQPQQLLVSLRTLQWERAADDGLADCIECGCCDLVCPSHIPLTQQFRHARVQWRARLRDGAEAEAARVRHEARQARLHRIEAEQARRAAARKAAMSSPDAVAAVIARARARKDPS